MSAANRLDYIDALRGWAILAVILVHVWIWTGASSDLITRLSSKGAYGVQLFYLISAFTLLLSFHHQQQKNHSWRDYCIRRFFRIAPLFYLAICLYGPMWQFVPRYWMPDGISAWHIMTSITFLHGWHPLSVNSIVPGGWSMAVEMTFYCLFPLLCMVITTLKRALIFVVVSLLLGMAVSAWAYQFYLPVVPERFNYVIKNFAYVYMPSAQLCVFGLGFIVYFLLADQRQFTEKCGRYFLVAAVLLMLTFSYIAPWAIPEFFMFAVAFMLLTLGFSSSRNPLLINVVIMRIGKLSYSLYLIHFGVIYLFRTYFNEYFSFDNKDLSLLLGFAAVTLVSVLLAFMSYRLVEKPGIAMGKRLIKMS